MGEEQRQKACKTAGVTVVDSLIQKLIYEHATELAVAVNAGEKDPPELAEVVVKENIEEEEIITDPVLKALRKYDEDHTNKIRLELLRELFDELTVDELDLGTHKFYGEITDPEISFVKDQLTQIGKVAGEDIEYTVLKEFIEDSEIAQEEGSRATNLVGTWMSMKMNPWLDKGDVACVLSPRSWRSRFDGTGGASARKGASPADDGDEDGQKDKKDKKDKKKDKKEKKDKKDKK